MYLYEGAKLQTGFVAVRYIHVHILGPFYAPTIFRVRFRYVPKYREYIGDNGESPYPIGA